MAATPSEVTVCLHNQNEPAGFDGGESNMKLRRGLHWASVVMFAVTSGCQKADQSHVLETAEVVAPLEFESANVDLGIVRNDVEHSFQFKSSAKVPITIVSVAPSCSCTVADPPVGPIAPGATGEIRLKIAQDRLSVGRHIYSADVVFRADAEFHKSVTLAATYEPSLRVAPDDLHVRLLPQGSEIRKCRVICGRKYAKFGDISVSGNQGIAVRQVNQEIADNDAVIFNYELVFSQSSLQNKPASVQSVVFQDRGIENSIATLHITVEPIARISIVPPIGRFRLDQMTSQWRNRVVVRDRDHEALHISSVTITGVSTSWKVQQSNDSSVAIIEIAAESPVSLDENNSYQGTIVTDQPCNAELEFSASFSPER